MTPELIEHLHEWIGNHSQSVNLPISNHTFLVPDHKQPGKKIRVSKLLLRVSICELHNYLISESSIYKLKEEIDDITGNILISDTALHALMPNNDLKITDSYKQMCGCKICVIIYSMQASLNFYWLENLNQLMKQARDKGGRIAHSGVDATEKANSYANNVYPNNRHIHFNPRDALFVIQYNPADEFSVPHFRMCPFTMQYVPKVLYTPRMNFN